MIKKISLLLVSLFLTLFLFECVARSFVKPSDYCYGVFFGRNLLPAKIKKPQDPSISGKSWYRGLIVNGRKITENDMSGTPREDGLLGYTVLENSISNNGWRQANALGAWDRNEVAKAIPSGVKRILAFGESFTQCQAVPQEDSWAFHLEKIGKGREVINFGVGGYSMCQAYLRYKTLANKIDHNVVLLGFVPSSDLIRDVTVDRGFFGWAAIMPRFEIEESRLKLIASPYKNQEAFFEDNQRGLTDQLKAHIRAHDRLYFLSRYEAVPILRDSVLLKLLASLNISWVNRSFRDPGSEAVQVSKKIFEAMSEDAHRFGSEFVLLILPDGRDVLRYKKSKRYRGKWERLVSAVVGQNMKYIDLMQGLKNAPDDQIDKAYDGGHYGPRANRLIAELIDRELARLHVG